MSQPSAPSDAELSVLKCFWRDGDLSAREVQDRIGVEQGWTSSTTRTVLERMRAKKLLGRRDVHGMAVYSTTQPKVAVIGVLMRRLGLCWKSTAPCRSQPSRAARFSTPRISRPSKRR